MTRTRPRRPYLSSVVALVACVLVGGSLRAATEYNPARRAPPVIAADAAESAAGTWRVVVRLAPEVLPAGGRAKSGGERASALAARTKVPMRAPRALTGALLALEAGAAVPGESAQSTLERLRADPQVLYAELDQWRYPHAVPSDPLATGQWYLQKAANAPSAINAIDAWDTSTGSAGVVVAVIDTGVRFDHPDLLRAADGGRLLPGFDFVNDVAVGNDGDGWDADPSDPGDWVTSAEAPSLRVRGCTASDSSWHGTRVSGMIGALTNNGNGIGGITWRTWLLPLRALGKCGGLDSDIVAAMLWAGGIAVNGAPANPYPARIVNMSLGSSGACSALYRDAVNQLAARGVLVVASAGNEGGVVGTPASCPGVAAVAGIRHVGTKVGFSNLGPSIALSAPGGNCVNVGPGQPCLFSLDTTTNTGRTVPEANGYTNQLDFNVGTSFSAPIVSGIAALMLAVNGGLDPTQLIARLREGATKPFPVSTDAAIPSCRVPTGGTDLQTSECNCTTTTCGAGMAHAPGSIAAAARPVAAVTLPAAVVAGQDLTLRGAGGPACGRSIASYAWSVVGVAGGATTPGLSGASSAIVTVAAPTGTGTYTLRLTVTDDAGRQDSADVTVAAAAATSAAPAALAGAACPAPLAAPSPSLSILPVRALVAAGTTRAFSSPLGAGTVLWQVNGVTGGSSSVGTITSAGLFTAPAAVPSPAAVTVSAVAAADPSRSAAAAVTITSAPASVAVSPATATLTPGATQVFAAAVANAPDGSGVTWSVNDVPGGNAVVGTISGSGVYAAPASLPSPASVTILAVAVADPSLTGSARVLLEAAPAPAPSPPPASATPAGGGGGGGAWDFVGLLWLAAMLPGRRRRRGA